MDEVWMNFESATVWSFKEPKWSFEELDHIESPFEQTHVQSIAPKFDMKCETEEVLWLAFKVSVRTITLIS